MVSEKFETNLLKNVRKQLKKQISGEIEVYYPNGETSQNAKLGKFASLVQFISEGPNLPFPSEYLMLKAQLANPVLKNLYLSFPVFHGSGKSVQGVTTIGVSIPFPIPETFVLRKPTLQSPKLLPYSLAVDQDLNIKTIIKENLITYEGVNQINRNKKLCKVLEGNAFCIISGLARNYQLKIPYDNGCYNYPMGMLSIIPYSGHTIIIAKEAGVNGSAAINSPKYPFKERYRAISGVAKTISNYPEHGKENGSIHVDKGLAHILGQIIPNIDGDGG